MRFEQEIENELKTILHNQDKIQHLYRRLELTHDSLFIPSFKQSHTVKINDIQVIYSEKDKIEIKDRFGQVFVSQQLSLPALEKHLAPYPQFIRSHRNYIANLNQLDYFAPSPTDSQGNLMVFKETGFDALLSAEKTKKAKAFFNIKSLDHVEPWDKQQQAIIDEKLRRFDKEIRLMSKEELLEHFHFQSTQEFNMWEFMANAIWEYVFLIKQGIRDPIEGNIRTFWYVIKPILGKAIPINSITQYQTMIDVFKKLVITHQLFKYKDFGFVDQGQHFYNLGKDYPHIIFLGEKTGHYRKLVRIQEEYGVTIIASGGMPSVLTSEYFVDELEKVIDIKTQSVYLITIVDYNPAGAILVKSFHQQLKRQGVEIAGLFHILIPEHFTPDELTLIADEIPMKTQADRTKALNWIKAGGGINGQPKGIETEALILDFERLKKLFKDGFDQVIHPREPSSVQSPYNPLRMEVRERELLGYLK